MKKFLLPTILMLFLSISVYAQFSGIISIPKVYVPGEILPGNVTPLGPNQFAFDIYLKNNGTSPWCYNAAQYGVSFNPTLSSVGSLSSTTVASGLPAAKQPGPATYAAGPPERIRFAQNTFGDGGPIFNPGDSVLIARALVTNTNNYPIATPNLVLRSVNPDRCAVFRYTGDGGTGNFGTATQLTTTLATYDNPVVPVELSSFTASMRVRDVLLNWETKTESNSSLFVIERALANDKSFVAIGQVTASGNSNSPKQYSFTDKKLQSGKYIYRLKMIDNDGTFEYSKEVEAEIALPKEYNISQNYPNPFNPSTKVDYQLPFDSKVSIELFGITGEKIATLLNNDVAAGYYTLEINAAQLNLASGVYLYRITANNQAGQNYIQVKKLLLNK